MKIKIEDLMDKEFGRLKIIREVERNKYSQRQVLCECLCEKKTQLIVELSTIIYGRRSSCGCVYTKRRKIENGEIFGLWKVLGPTKEGKRTYYKCECQCESKVIKDIQGCALLSNRAKSCGCETINTRAKNLTRHGNSKRINGYKVTYEYTTWMHIKGRCYNKNNHKYNDYGGRGIKVCNRWLEKFENFLEDMGKKPDDKVSIDRIDNNGDYCKENCRWADNLEQSSNKRNNIILEIDGQKDIASNWARKFNLKPSLVLTRIRKGISIDKIFLPPKTNKIKGV